MTATGSETFEVEMKFPVDRLDAIEVRLLELGGIHDGTVSQIDRYFAHPTRDFAASDEAFRMRSVGERNFLTYKGPKLDVVTKTRREIEVPIGAGEATADRMETLLTSLGFQRVALVRKTRRIIRLTWQDRPVEAALDDVAEVGFFLELELLAAADQIAAARHALLALSQQLGLIRSERRGYLQLLLESRATRANSSLNT